MTRKALGRGLSALLREVETTTTGLDQIPVTLIDPNPYQPRRTFPETSLRELAESIRAGGLLQPVLVRRADARYQLVAGERRWRAACLAGLQAIPAVIRELDDREALELALTENLLREDLNPLEVARAFDALQEKYQLSHEEIAERMVLNRSTVTNTLRLLRLPSSIQEMLAHGELSHGHARALLGLHSESAQIQLAQMATKQGLSVRQIETVVAGRQLKPARTTSSPGSQPDPNTRAAVLDLERALGTKVRIVGSGKNGRIEISYFSSEDLNRIYECIIRR
jgi:ParB family chromosome partitioning protein